MMFANEIAMVTRMRYLIFPVPDIIRPPYGARVSIIAADVGNLLDRLETKLARFDDVQWSTPMDDPEIWDKMRMWWKVPPRTRLRERAGELPLPRFYDPKKEKFPLSFNEHKLLGNDLKEMQRLIVKLQVAFGNHRPRSATQKSAFALANRIQKKLLSLLSDLDSIVCGENPDEPRPMDVYFGKTDDEKALDVNALMDI